MKFSDVKARELFDLIKGRTTTSATAPVSGKTSSFGAADLKLLETAINNITAASNIAIPKMPNPPRLLMPNIPDFYTVAAEATGQCPHELKTIVEVGFKNLEGNDLAIAAFKKFLVAVRMSDADAVDAATTTKKDIRQRKTDHEMAVKHYQDLTTIQRKAEEAREKKIAEAKAGHMKAWSSIMIKLETTLMRNPKVEELGDVDRWMVMSLDRLIDKPIKIVGGKAKLDFRKACMMSTDDIKNVQDRLPVMREQERRSREHEFLQTAPLKELRELMWSTSSRDLQDTIGEAIRMREEHDMMRRRLEYRDKYPDEDDPFHKYTDPYDFDRFGRSRGYRY